MADVTIPFYPAPKKNFIQQSLHYLAKRIRPGISTAISLYPTTVGIYIHLWKFDRWMLKTT